MSHASQHLEAKIEAILAAFANAAEHIVPEQALTDAYDHQQALIPHLQQAVAQAHALSAVGRLQAEGDWRLPAFALHLLAVLRGGLADGGGFAGGVDRDPGFSDSSRSHPWFTRNSQGLSGKGTNQPPRVRQAQVPARWS